MFLFLFVFVCNQREMAVGGFAGFVVFLAVVAFVSEIVYPLYHLYVLLNIGHKLRSLLNKSQQNNETSQT